MSTYLSYNHTHTLFSLLDLHPTNLLSMFHPDARAGQGIFYSASTNTYSVRDCGVGQYGLPNATYGLDPFPCRDCPKGMTTSKTFAQSAQYYVEDSAGRGGFTDIKACVTMPGWAYRGRTAERCPAGTWAAPGSGSCTP